MKHASAESMHLYDSLTRTVREFEPLEPNRVGMYVCGPTVQASPHIGHLRSMVVFDVLRRWLEDRGNQVTFIRNVTDIDDKIIHNAAHADVPWWALAQKFEQEFTKADEAIGNLAPTYQPRAAGSIPQIIEFIDVLIGKGVAYVGDGSVWFSVSKFSDYGVLSGQQTEAMLASPEQEPGKQDPHDFALWKSAKPGEPFWSSPWGPGRPGWHIECSAMSLAYLGSHFDIHGGGRDLIFPHHENERAQSVSAGHLFANFWVHNSWVTTAGEKMSKSLGNSLRVSEVMKLVKPIELRYYLLSAHYRSNLEYSIEALQEAATSFRRLASLIERATPPDARTSFKKQSTEALPPAFVVAMNDDLATPAAFAALHELATAANTNLAAGDVAEAAVIANSIRSALAVLGCDPWSDSWQHDAIDNDSGGALALLVETLIEERDVARAAGEYQRADSIRETLQAAGVQLADSNDQTRWSLSGEG